MFVKTKGKRNRTIPISKALYDEINPRGIGRIFTCGYDVAYKWLTKALPEPPDGQATNVLRHTLTTDFMCKGGNILDLKETLDHSKIKQTMIYAHFFTKSFIIYCQVKPDHQTEFISPKVATKWRQRISFGVKIRLKSK